MATVSEARVGQHTRGRRALRTGLVAAATAGLVATGLAVSTTQAVEPAAAATAKPAAAPSLFVPASVGAQRMTAPRSLAGTHRLVTLRTSLLPKQATGQRIGFDVGSGRSLTGRFTAVDRQASYTAWTGTLEDDAQGTFAIVKSGSTYRAEVISPRGGVYDVRLAGGHHYWLTAVAPQPRQAGDERPGPVSKQAQRALRSARQSSATSPAGRRAKSRIDVMFAYTKSAKQTAGSKAQLKADAALVITQTNQTLKNSGDRVVLHYRGMVRAHGTEGKNPINDAFRIARPHDGHFDALQVARRHHHADLIHLFTGGPPGRLEGGGLIPFKPALANPGADASVSNLAGLPYLVSTHELGHNLGADHIQYPGIAHNSRDPYAYGFYNVPGNYVTVMSYYDPCYDNGNYTCVRIPWFSSPTNTDNGLPLGLNRYTDNAKVVAQTAPRVARYAR